MAKILFIVQDKLKSDFFKKADSVGGASYVLREMMENYVAGKFETKREKAIRDSLEGMK